MGRSRVATPRDLELRDGIQARIFGYRMAASVVFPRHSATYDWGAVGEPCFDPKQLHQLKCECQSHCFSTLNHNLSYCYRTSRAVKWVLKQVLHGFRGATGCFED